MALTAGLIGAGISAAGSYIGAQAQAGAAQTAATEETQAAQEAIQANKNALDRQNANLKPFLDSGTAANDTLAFLTGVGGANGPGAGPRIYNGQIFNSPTEFLNGTTGWGDPALVAADPLQMANINSAYYALPVTPGGAARGRCAWRIWFAYRTGSQWQALPPILSMHPNGLQFGLNLQGTKAVNAGALAGGTYDSGATLKALTQFGNDYGTTKTQAGVADITGQRQSIYNMLSGEAGTGLSAAGGANAALGANAASNSNLITGAGNAQAAGTIGAANAFSGIGNSVSSAYSKWRMRPQTSNLFCSKSLRKASTISRFTRMALRMSETPERLVQTAAGA